MDENRLGALLLENPVMREEDLERCLEIQRLTGHTRPLGQILVDEGVLTASALDELLQLQTIRRRLDEARPALEGEDVGRYLRAASMAGASDLFCSAGHPAAMRVAGVLRPLGEVPLRAVEVFDLLRSQAGEAAETELTERGSVQRNLQLADGQRVRLDAYWHLDGPAVTLRLHPAVPRRLADLGLEGELVDVLRGGSGLVLVAGQARSGLTEALGAMLQEIAHDPDRVVLVLDESLEHPVPDGALVIQRRIGHDVPDVATGLRSALAREADAVVIDRITDPVALDLCLHAASTDRLVVAAVSARSVLSALRLALHLYASADTAHARAALANVLRAVVAVRLIPDRHQTRSLPVSELLLMDEAVREVMRQGGLDQLGVLMRLEGVAYGHSIDESLRALLASEQIRLEDAFAHAEDKTGMLESVRRRRVVRADAR